MEQLKKDYYSDSKQLIIRMLRDNFPQYQRNNVNKIIDILTKKKDTLLTELDKHACNMLFKKIAKVPSYQISLISPELEIIINNASNIIIHMSTVCTSKPSSSSSPSSPSSPSKPSKPSKLSKLSNLKTTSLSSNDQFDEFGDPSQLPPPPPIPQAKSLKNIDYINIKYSNIPVPFTGQFYKTDIDKNIVGGNKRRKKSSKRRYK
jgi:hypothetical protein